MISCIMLTFVGFFILLNKKFHKHPYQLIGLALIFQAMVYYAEWAVFFIFPLNLHYIATIYRYSINLLDFSNMGQTIANLK